MQFVLDASVVLTWCFPDENSSYAAHVAHLFRLGHRAVVPAFWPHEVLNALLAGERRKRITAPQTRSFLADLASLPIELQPCSTPRVFTEIQSLSRQYGLTAYDAAYLFLAVDAALPLATLDADLARARERAGVQRI